MMKKRKHKKLPAFFEYGLYTLILLAVLFLVPKFVLEKVLVDGESMENSLFERLCRLSEIQFISMERY